MKKLCQQTSLRAILRTAWDSAEIRVELRAEKRPQTILTTIQRATLTQTGMNVKRRKNWEMEEIMAKIARKVTTCESKFRQ